MLALQEQSCCAHAEWPICVTKKNNQVPLVEAMKKSRCELLCFILSPFWTLCLGEEALHLGLLSCMNKEGFYRREQRSSRDVVSALNPDDLLLPSPQFTLCLSGLPTNFPLAFEVCVQPVCVEWSSCAMQQTGQCSASAGLQMGFSLISDEYFEEQNFTGKLDAPMQYTGGNAALGSHRHHQALV